MSEAKLHQRPRIGIPACLMHEDPERPLFKGKALQYTEKKMALAVWRAGGLPVQILDLDERDAVEEAVASCDGLLLQGGADVHPGHYGEEALRPEWNGDAVRDRFEFSALELALAHKKPVFGVCRGAQVINVGLGGSLYQDINTQVEGSLVHRDWHRYEVIEHGVRLESDSWVARAWDSEELLTNTIHHQAVKQPGEGLRVVARAPDGIIEAVESITDERWIVGVQWHPEWLDGSEVGGPHRSPGRLAFEAYLRVCNERR